MRETHSKHLTDGRACPQKRGIGRSKVAASAIMDGEGNFEFLHGVFFNQTGVDDAEEKKIITKQKIHPLISFLPHTPARSPLKLQIQLPAYSYRLISIAIA